MTQAPLSWVKEIQTTLIETGAIPLFGYPPPFPWDDFSERVAALLQAEECKITLKQTAVLKGNQITAGFGADFLAIHLDLTPLNGQVAWLMGKEDVAKLTALALTSSQNGKGLLSSQFQEGFYYYLATQIVHAVDALKAFGDLSLKIAKPTASLQEESLCIDVEIRVAQLTLWGRLVCPAPFHEAFKTHFKTVQDVPLTSEFAKQTSVSVSLEVGQTKLSVAKFKQLHVGDFIVLDRCTFDPKTQKGAVTLVLEQTPLLRARIKDTSLKIVDYAQYREELNPMNPKMPHENENEGSDELSPDEFETDLSSEEEHLWSSENEGAKQLVAPEQIPMTLSVEVARLKITLEKLLQLSPGNVLELPVKPEHGVDIVVGGKKVARAELVKLGEMLGVKILQLGE